MAPRDKGKVLGVTLEEEGAPMQRPLVQPNASGTHFGQIGTNSHEIRTNFTETSAFRHLPHTFVGMKFVRNSYKFRANFCKFVEKVSKQAQLHKGHTL